MAFLGYQGWGIELKAEHQVRKIIGYQQLAELALAIEHDLASSATTEKAATSTNA